MKKVVPIDEIPMAKTKHTVQVLRDRESNVLALKFIESDGGEETGDEEKNVTDDEAGSTLPTVEPVLVDLSEENDVLFFDKKTSIGHRINHAQFR